MRTFTVFLTALLIAAVVGATDGRAQQAPPPGPPATYNSPFAERDREGPPVARGGGSGADLWRQVRQGESGFVGIPDRRAGVMIQDAGSQWRAWRNGPLATYGVWALAGMVGFLTLFFLVRGRIRIESGWSGRRILRFTLVERAGHWLTAGSFLVLGITGLNVLYGKYWLMPMIGKPAFAAITEWGKLAHNWVAWGFMLGLAMILVMWAKDNVWDRYDANWISRGGGLFTKGSHPPAGKFNFGQKMIFWAVILGGLAVSVTGLNLLFPFAFTGMQGLQLAQLAHGAASLGLTVVILAHIYIGSVGMEGAFDAMNSGMVDENWAREHHSAWVEERYGVRRPVEPPPSQAPSGAQPAE